MIHNVEPLVGELYYTLNGRGRVVCQPPYWYGEVRTRGNRWLSKAYTDMRYAVLAVNRCSK